MTVREKMQAGKIYTDMTEGLPEERIRCRELVSAYNATEIHEEKRRTDILKDLLGSVGEDVYLEPPVRFAYGSRTHMGNQVYANFNLVIVDDIEVFIGNHVMFAPNVTITVTGHPVHPKLRKNGDQFSFSVHIEDDVWIGSNVVILPGVTIGRNSVIGAGSVVTRDIPPNVVAAGNPCRVMREITDRDLEYYYRDLKAEE